MTGTRMGAGDSVSILITLYPHRKAIDQVMTGVVCFTVCFGSYFCWKTPVLFVLIKPLEVTILSPVHLSWLIKTLSSGRR